MMTAFEPTEIDIVMEVMRKQLMMQLSKGYGTATFTIQIQDGRIVHVKCSQETSVKIGA